MIYNNFYLLRWRFDFADGITRYGMWSDPGNISENGAWRQTRAGLRLIRAAIEAKDFNTRTIQVMAECDGHDYMNFEWIALARINPFMKGSCTPNSSINGLSLVTRQEIIRVLCDGQIIKEPLPLSHQKINFSTFGK